SDMAVLTLFRSLQTCRGRAEIFPEMFERARYGVGREAAERAERAEFHGIAEVFDDGDIFRHAFAGANLVDGLHPAGRADPAGRALAAGFDGAKLHRKARLLCHVDGVIEHHDAAMADQAIARGESLIVEWRIEQRAGEISPERAADLHSAYRAAGERAAADLVDEFAKRNAEGDLEQAAIFDVARK